MCVAICRKSWRKTPAAGVMFDVAKCEPQGGSRAEVGGGGQTHSSGGGASKVVETPACPSEVADFSRDCSSWCCHRIAVVLSTTPPRQINGSGPPADFMKSRVSSPRVTLKGTQTLAWESVSLASSQGADSVCLQGKERCSP